ncbi:phosphodiesterase YaeI [Hartmannibacter diazotrophicus]|uniref:Phosphodiesterase YaeI n=1 Tax=Hartmannibacter diazotrophicus TaxID=1482074 RepID=A0A2C9DB50_9HYPH|nr:metallophosphoesterase [Hartmannibacter diazotrophicus]SON57552.1 phosphodiesterase YaeI [Hartmannibacter diazotrophicus]
MISRRTFLKLAGSALFSAIPMTAYAGLIETRYKLVTTRYEIGIPGWDDSHGRMRIAVVADIHACEPWMPLSRVSEIVEATNALKPDVTLLLGDYAAGMEHFKTADVAIADWARALGRLRAPLGVHAVLGNHDWAVGGEFCRFFLDDYAGVPVMENKAVRLSTPNGGHFWLAGLGDQIGINDYGRPGRDNLPGTLAQVTTDDPVIMMAHEPDIFPFMPARVGLTISGHTHGGQVSLPGIGPLIVPSRFGTRYAYGHVVERGRQLLVSGGLGCSRLPIRFGRPPELVLLDIVPGKSIQGPVIGLSETAQVEDHTLA